MARKRGGVRTRKRAPLPAVVPTSGESPASMESSISLPTGGDAVKKQQKKMTTKPARKRKSASRMVLQAKEDEDNTSNDGDDGPVAKKMKRSVTIPGHITVLNGDPIMYQCAVCEKKFKTKSNIQYHEFCQNAGGDKPKPFKCTECDEGFISKSHYKYHLLTHTGERPYPCRVCEKRFKTWGHVKRHIIQSHPGDADSIQTHSLVATRKGPLVCTELGCNQQFVGSANLRKHYLLNHTDDRPFSCDHCNKSFAFKEALSNHLKIHISEQKRPFACDYDQCTKTFYESKDLRRHQLSHTGERQFCCEKCGKSFGRKDNFSRHIEQTHKQSKEIANKLANEMAKIIEMKRDGRNVHAKSTKSERKLGNRVVIEKEKHRAHLSLTTSPNSLVAVANVENEILDKSSPGQDKQKEDEYNETTNKKDEDRTVAKKNMRSTKIPDHITVLDEDPPIFQCTVCNKKFKTKINIKYHEFCQNTDKPFKCEECGQGFISKGHYKYHLRTHTGERPYICTICNKRFNQQSNLNRHMRSHSEEKSFACDECDQRFTNAQTLRSHSISHSSKVPLKCTMCDKQFKNKALLNKHTTRIHTGSFACDHCDKRYALKITLVAHLKTHSKDRPHPCDQCDKAFQTSKDLRRHLLSHTGEQSFRCDECEKSFSRKDNLCRHIEQTHHKSKDIANNLANEATSKAVTRQIFFSIYKK